MAAVEKPRPIDERRAGFKRYKEDVASRGKPFYPYAMLHDTVMSLFVVAVIMGIHALGGLDYHPTAAEADYFKAKAH